MPEVTERHMEAMFLLAGIWDAGEAGGEEFEKYLARCTERIASALSAAEERGRQEERERLLDIVRIHSEYSGKPKDICLSIARALRSSATPDKEAPCAPS